MSEIYIFSQDDEQLTILSESTGLISAPFKDVLNNVPDEPFVFEVEADEPRAKYVVEENQVVFRDREGDLQLYVIKEIDDLDTIDGPITTATCQPAYQELAENTVVDRRFVDKEAQEALNGALDGTRWTGVVEVSLGKATTNFYYISSLEAIWRILKTWGGEFKAVVTFEGNKITKREIQIKQRRGADRGLRFEIDHNIEEIQRTVLSYPVTALYGRGASLEIEDEDGNATGGHTRLIDFADVEWKKSKGDPVDKPKGQKWIGDPDALARYGRKHDGQLLHRFGVWENGDYDDPAKLLKATWDALQEMKKPEVNYRLSVDLLDKRAELGDAAIAIDRQFARPVEVQTRIIAIEYDLLDIEGTTVVEMGQFLSAYDDDIDRRLDDLNNKIDKIRVDTGPIDNSRFPNIKPDTPINVEATGGIETIQLYWDYDEHIYISHYEVYGSPVKDFVPDTQHLLWRGRVSGFAHEVGTAQRWYYYVRAVNTHGRASEYSQQVSAATSRVGYEDIEQDVKNSIDTARNKADEAVEKVNLATGNANEAIEEAQKAFDEATNAHTIADAAKKAGETAGRVAGEAQEQANTAKADAQKAMSDAQKALKDVDSLETSVTQEFETINGQLKSKIGETEFNGLKSTVTNHSTLIQQTQVDIKSKADKTVVDTINKTVDSHGTLIQQNAKDIQSKATQSSVDTLNKKVVSHESLISQNAKAIESKISTTDADAKYATQSQLTQTSTSLTSEIAKVQTDIDGLEIGGRNLLLGTSNITKQGTDFSTWNSDMYVVSDNVVSEIKEGGKYTISVEFIETYSNDGSRFGLILQLFANGSMHSQYFDYGTFLNTGETGYSIYTLDLPNVSSNESIDEVRVYIRSSNNIGTSENGKRVKYRNLKLEKGNKATDWTPAPEDMTTNVEFSQLEQTVDSISGQVTKKLDKTVYDSFVQQTAQSLSSKISTIDADKKYATQSSLTQTAQGLQTAVNNKADKSVVTQLAGVVDSKISTNDANAKFATQSQLTQTSSSLQSTITSVRDDLDNLEIDSKNLITDTEKEWETTTIASNSAYGIYRTNLNNIFSDFVNKDVSFRFEVLMVNTKDKEANFRIYGTNGTPKYRFENLVFRNIETNKWVVVNGTTKMIETSSTGQGRIEFYGENNPNTTKIKIRNFKMVGGSKAPLTWTPAPEDMATQSQISQLATDINFRVKKGDTITQINIDGQNSSVLIDGKYVHITGQTKIDNGVIKTLMVADGTIINSKIGNLAVDTAKLANAAVTNAKIASLRADKIDGGIINGNVVTVKVTNGKQELRLDDTGLRSIDSSGRDRIHLGVRNLAGKGQSDPATLRFFSGNGSVSAGIGMNVNDTFVIGSSASQMAMELYSGKNTIMYGQQIRIVPHNIENGHYLRIDSVSNTGGLAQEIRVSPPISGTGYVGSTGYRWWRVYTNHLHYLEQHKLSTRSSKTDIKQLDINEAQRIFDGITLNEFRYLKPNGSASENISFGVITDESPIEILDAEQESVNQDNYIGVIAGSLKYQTSRVDQMESIFEHLVMKNAELEERLNKLEEA